MDDMSTTARPDHERLFGVFAALSPRLWGEPAPAARPSG